MAFYRLVNPRNERFVVEAPMFRRRLRFVLHLTSAHERMAYLMGQYEEETSQLLAALWTGGAVVDVGANIGFVSLPTAILLEAESPFVFAVEALPSNFATLVQNIGINKLQPRVIPLAVALGASDGVRVFIQIEGDDPRETGTGNILPESYQFERIPLELRTLDRLVSERVLPADIGVMKIDTDGYDLEVLRGAEEVLRAARPVVVAELSGHCMSWHGQTHADVVRFLETVGYELWVPERYGSQHFVPFRASTVPPDDCLLLPVERRGEMLSRVEDHLKRRGRSPVRSRHVSPTAQTSAAGGAFTRQ